MPMVESAAKRKFVQSSTIYSFDMGDCITMQVWVGANSHSVPPISDKSYALTDYKYVTVVLLKALTFGNIARKYITKTTEEWPDAKDFDLRRLTLEEANELYDFILKKVSKTERPVAKSKRSRHVPTYEINIERSIGHSGNKLLQINMNAIICKTFKYTMPATVLFKKKNEYILVGDISQIMEHVRQADADSNK